MFATASSKGVAAEIPSQSIWISLWGEIRDGGESHFLTACELLAAEKGKDRLVLGGEEFHFVPGVPVDEDPGRRLMAAARTLGFESAETCDYAGDVNSSAVRAYAQEAMARACAEKWSLREASTAAELDELGRFLEKEFPGRWAREFHFWRGSFESQRGIWMLFRDDAENLIGFARIAVRARFAPVSSGWNPGAMRLPNREGAPVHGAVNDGCLGPIGVAGNERGRGAGKILLGMVLEKLRQNNAAQICVDWTNAYKYYMPLRFRVVRRFCAAWKKRQV